MKKCTKCKLEKYITEFWNNRTKKDGVSNECKKCQGNHNKQYRLTHQAAIKQQHKHYYQDHQEERKKYIIDNKKVISEKQKQYRKTHTKERAQKWQQYYQTHKEEIIKYRKEYGQNHKLERANATYQRRYQINYQKVLEILQKQKEKCPICEQNIYVGNTNSNSAVVDHDHNTKIVRGLLCHQCNTALGGFKDNPKLLLRAARYLQNSLLTKPNKSAKVVNTNTV